MSALLLVRSSDDMRSAVKAVNEFLVYRRQHLGTPRDTDQVLGTWIRRDLDAGLPTWPCFDAVPGKTDKAPVERGQTAPGCGSGEAAVGIRESFSLSGIWTLCWIDGLPMREARSRAWMFWRVMSEGSSPASMRSAASTSRSKASSIGTTRSSTPSSRQRVAAAVRVSSPEKRLGM